MNKVNAKLRHKQVKNKPIVKYIRLESPPPTERTIRLNRLKIKRGKSIDKFYQIKK